MIRKIKNLSTTKKLSTIITAVCAAIMFALYCTSFEFENPVDPKNSGGDNSHVNPWDNMSCNATGDCVEIVSADAWNSCPVDNRFLTATCTGESRCNLGVDCGGDMGSCMLHQGGCTNDVSRNQCSNGRFTFNEPCPVVGQKGTFVDERDQKTYNTVVMPDGKIWMAQNLNFVTDNSWCYNNQTSNCNTYGRLYDWSTAQTVCPDGWRLPRDNEWATLVNIIGSNAGTKLKSTSGWNDDGNGTDDFDFSALPGGRRWSGNFHDVGNFGEWWTATEHNENNARRRFISHNSVTVSSDSHTKLSGLSVRCVKD